MDRSDRGFAVVRESVEVVYALPDVQRTVTLPLEPGLTARQAVERSGLARDFPEIAARELALGLYGQRIEPDRILAAGDRVEICRPLERDPREQRRELLRHGLVMGESGPPPRDGRRR
jgi:putative ubiquitin-RnfH superfamily antitoxin RatB of RatAB toxin-antitoxin module